VTLLSLNTIPDVVPPNAQHGLTNERLFPSNVNPLPVHAGAFVVPLLTVVFTTSVAPVLNVAVGMLPPSPKILNSASVHPCDRLSTVSWPDALYRLVPVDRTTVSKPPDVDVPVSD